MAKQEYYELLWQCIKSDQVSAFQVQEHLKDRLFKIWLQRKEKQNVKNK